MADVADDRPRDEQPVADEPAAPRPTRAIAIIALVGMADVVIGAVLGVIGLIAPHQALALVGGAIAVSGMVVVAVATVINSRYRAGR
jgi:hypothetical protein